MPAAVTRRSGEVLVRAEFAFIDRPSKEYTLSLVMAKHPRA
jgi:hypothetical protein